LSSQSPGPADRRDHRNQLCGGLSAAGVAFFKEFHIKGNPVAVMLDGDASSNEQMTPSSASTCAAPRGGAVAAAQLGAIWAPLALKKRPIVRLFEFPVPIHARRFASIAASQQANAESAL
jgi:hypothetical protein